jgi:Ca2+-binding EF-hand superfamily protein
LKRVLAIAVLVCAANPAFAQQRPRYDLNGDGKVSKEEFRSVQIAQTMRLDRDKDGRVTREETRALEGMAKAFGGKAAAARIAGLWTLTDTNRDSAITRAEAGAATDKRFPTYDLNKDGALSTAELEAIRKRSPGAR